MCNRPEPSKWRTLWLIVAAITFFACGTLGSSGSSQTEVGDDGSFTISERVRVGPDVQADFDHALRMLAQQQYADGIALLVEVTEAAPDLTAAHIDLGIAYGQVNDLARAEASLERALELSPRHPVAHNELGIVYRRAGRFEDARKSYERALELHPEFHYARRNLAILCDVYLSDAACALRHYERYASAVPDDEAAAIWIADLRNRIAKQERP